MSLGNGTRSVPPSHIEIVAESLCGWACLRESVLIGGSNVASRRGFEIEDFLQYGFGSQRSGRGNGLGRSENKRPEQRRS
ncbi:hypothetical protein TNCV_65101 [Trichonephila clavipes]|nr:hypothetical protein TNCV_65101 [Trichonephila clavipes]